MLNAIYPIVEGHGEVQAVPVLLRRFAHEVFENYEIQILPPHRIPKGQILEGPNFGKAVELAARKLNLAERTGALLVLFDADDDCPAQTAPQIMARIGATRPDMAASVVLPKCEFESWFLAAANSLRGRHNILADAAAPENPEEIRAAKEYLETRLMPPRATYSPTIDQAALTKYFSFEEAALCSSFSKLMRDLDRLFAL